MSDQCTVYVLKSQHTPPHFYVGRTVAIAPRLLDHNAGLCAPTAPYRPWTLHVVIHFADERTARKFERYLKTGSGRAFAKRHFEEPGTSEDDPDG